MWKTSHVIRQFQVTSKRLNSVAEIKKCRADLGFETVAEKLLELKEHHCTTLLKKFA
jgi:hypothetical protein